MNKELELIVRQGEKQRKLAEQNLAEGESWPAQGAEFVLGTYLHGILRMQMALYEQNKTLIKLYDFE